MKNHLLASALCLFSLAALPVAAQSVLITYFDPTTNQSNIVSVDLSTCAVTPVISGINHFVLDALLADNGTYYITASIPGNGGNQTGLYTVDPASGATTLLLTIPSNFVEQSHIYQLDANTLIITSSASEVIYSYNIATNTLTALGNANLDGFSDIFEYQGNVYIRFLGTNGMSSLHQINFSPFSLTPVAPVGPALSLAAGACNQVFSVSFPDAGNYPGVTITQINMNNYTPDAVCLDLPGLQGMLVRAISPDPGNTSGPLCNCTSESGTIAPSSSGLYQACGENPIPIPHQGNAALDGDDALVFLLVAQSGPGLYDNFPNNVLYVYDTPLATFQPGITVPGELYFIYPAAGNAAPGGVDLNDICLDIGNLVTIRWIEAPTVSFEQVSANCSTGCQLLLASFTGTAPFALTYSVTTDNGQTSSFTQNTSSSTLNLNVCPPPGYTGGISVQATNLLGGGCPCGQ
jgi:hypothetical protein